mgnify:CR=1 FL=1
MHVTLTFRHIDASDAVKAHATERLEKIQKYFPDPIGGHILFSVSKSHQSEVEVHLTLHDGTLLKSVEHAENMYAAIGLAMANIESQARKHKEKTRSHRRVDHETRNAELGNTPNES